MPRLDPHVSTRAGVVLPLLLAAACGGSLSHRSVAELAGQVPIGPTIQRLRIEVPTGTVGIAAGVGGELRFGGGVRRAADSAAALAALESIPLVLSPVVDAADPTLLVVRAPGIAGTDLQGLFGLELGLHVPPTLPVEVVVGGSGHVTLADRAAATKVTTGRGDLRFERCTGSLTARTGRGNVIAFEHRGDIDLDAGFGDMQVFVRQPGGHIRLVTGQGTVQCHVPPTTGFEVDAAASIGRIGNGFGLEAQKPTQYSAVLRGKVGDGATSIVLRTGSGHLSLSPKVYD